MSALKWKTWLWPGLFVLYFGAQMLTDDGLVRGPAPPIEKTRMGGWPFTLSDFRGSPSVIYFWASWCSVCRAMQSNIEAVAADHRLVSIALQSGTDQELSRYLRERNVNVRVVSDADGSISDRYGVRAVPAVFILDPEGRIRFGLMGYTTEIGIRARLWWLRLTG